MTTFRVIPNEDNTCWRVTREPNEYPDSLGTMFCNDNDSQTNFVQDAPFTAQDAIDDATRKALANRPSRVIANGLVTEYA